MNKKNLWVPSDFEELRPCLLKLKQYEKPPVEVADSIIALSIVGAVLLLGVGPPGLLDVSSVLCFVEPN